MQLGYSRIDAFPNETIHAQTISILTGKEGTEEEYVREEFKTMNKSVDVECDVINATLNQKAIVLNVTRKNCAKKFSEDVSVRKRIANNIRRAIGL